jgi:hypothetical protein
LNDHAAAWALAAARGNAPVIATRQRLGVGVQELRSRIEAVHVRFRIGDPIHAISIIDARIEPLQESVPDLARAMEAGVEGKLQDRLLLTRDED